MGSYWNTIRAWWFGLSPLLFIVFTNALMILVSVFISPILILLGLDPSVDLGGPDFGDLSPYAISFIAVIIAPILETFIFQYLPVKLLSGRIPTLGVILISSIFFAVAHAGYSIWYAILVFPLGVILVYVYIHYSHEKITPYWMTTLIHAFRNMLALFAMYFI